MLSSQTRWGREDTTASDESEGPGGGAFRKNALISHSLRAAVGTADADRDGGQD
jgi:hypothetical protein